jgi:SAM-dependent methyltransferase
LFHFLARSGLELSKFNRANIGSYLGVDASVETVERAKQMGKGSKIPQTYFAQNPFKQPFSSDVPAGSCDCVYVFNDTHLLMESRDTASCFFSNAAKVLKSNGLFVLLMHDGGSLWYSLQKDVPEVVPEDYKPYFKRKLFSVSLEDGMIKDRVFGVKYRLKIKADKKDLMHGFLINSSVLREVANGAGFDLLNLFSCGELADLYKPMYGEALKKKANFSTLQHEQKEYVDLFQVGVFKLRE